MDKITWLAELAEGLARWVPERERQDILRYYAEYFEEAGPGREGEVVAELGDPWALSCRLAVEGGYVSWEQANAWTPPQKKRKVWPIVAAATAAVLVFTVVGGIMMAVRVGSTVGRAVAEAVGGSGEVWVEQEQPNYMVGEACSMEEGSLEAFSSIDADIGLGNIKIDVGNDYTLSIEQSGVLSGYGVTWSVKSDGTLKIRDGGGKELGPEALRDLFGSSSVSVTITVPDGTPLEKVDVKTGLGNVYIAHVDADTVKAESGTGDVECFEARVFGKLDMKSGVGDVALGLSELYAGMKIGMKSGLGQVEATLFCREMECAYDLETGLGEVIVNGDGRGSSARVKDDARPYKLEAESGLGDVNVIFEMD